MPIKPSETDFESEYAIALRKVIDCINFFVMLNADKKAEGIYIYDVYMLRALGLDATRRPDRITQDIIFDALHRFNEAGWRVEWHNATGAWQLTSRDNPAAEVTALDTV